MTPVEKVTELHILEEGKSFFDSVQYIIPLYQRDYAWEEKQITQLIEDIDDVSLGENYYIGSLIVAAKGNIYEVVDGQQRLTTLYLLLGCLEKNDGNEGALSFSCRPKSNYTLRHIKPILKDERDLYDSANLQQNIISGLNIIKESINRFSEEHKSDFIQKLKNVVIYRIEVPNHTDLNHYFEIMNTRGEQLEQSDVLKARLMSVLDNNKDQQVFAAIWNACRDMSGYVQMHFTPAQRDALFGNDWTQIPFPQFPDSPTLYESSSSNAGATILQIVRPDFKIDNVDEGYLDDETRVRFESVIDFPYFLLHVLKIYLSRHPETKHKNGNGEKLVPDSLDDKKLTATFERVLSNGVINDRPIDPSVFVREFIVCMLRTRFLFDKYIIKREYANESTDGEWSLKSLCVSGRQKKAYYVNTRFAASGQTEAISQQYHNENLMLQSALRVSYTSPKTMHWITNLLKWLTENISYLDANILRYTDEINKTIKEPVKKFIEEEKFSLGVNTPHVVFNYLDYLIWKKDDKSEAFEFEFRNSVEHWYPRKPSEGTFERWENEDKVNNVDRFGNLCLIQRNVNSRFSNLSPEAKKSTFKDMINKGSLKLRLMSELTQGTNASQQWKATIVAKHEQEMLDLLRKNIAETGA